jgi:protein-L-isoaspartate(D-aspartate) O-methyltransferase
MSPPGSETTSTEEDPYADRRADMVERQLRRRGIEDERVLAAMAEVPRERFVPERDRRQAYRDGAMRIGEGQTISQPWIVASMAALLELRGDERVLEVGTGSGYAAAVLSRLCREVVTIERHAGLAATAVEVLRELGYDNVEVRVGDGTAGAPDKAPFGSISVTATAADDPPRALFDQLAPGGALVCPVNRGGHELLMRFRGGAEEAFAAVRFVPLVIDRGASRPTSR